MASRGAAQSLRAVAPPLLSECYATTRSWGGSEGSQIPPKTASPQSRGEARRGRRPLRKLLLLDLLRRSRSRSRNVLDVEGEALHTSLCERYLWPVLDQLE